MSKFQRHFQSPINKRLTIAILLASTFFAMFMVAIQLVNTYLESVKNVYSDIDRLVSSRQETLTRLLWDVDLPLLEAEVKSFLMVPVIVSAEVNNQAGVDYHFQKRHVQYNQKKTYPLIFQQTSVGTLTLEISLDSVYSELQGQFFIILLTNGAKTFLMGFIIILLLHHMISKNLLILANQAESLSLDRLKKPLTRYIGSEDPRDELYIVSSAMEKMRLRLRHDLANRLRIERKLRRYQNTLEEMVQERTRKLEAANQQLTALASTDDLTGLYNRRPFKQQVLHSIQQAARNNKQLAVVIMDIDDFKAYNDTYGHLQGDECLKQVAKTLQHQIRRGTDIVARIGGEEFAACFYAVDPDDLPQLCMQLTQAIYDLKIEHKTARAADRVTISLGAYSLIPQLNTLTADLLEKADTALYSAKEQGRNRAVIQFN